MPESRPQRELLARIDERTLNIWSSVEAMEKHLKELNARTGKNEVAIAINKANTSSNKGIIYKLGIPVCIAIVGLAITLICKTIGVF